MEQTYLYRFWDVLRAAIHLEKEEARGRNKVKANSYSQRLVPEVEDDPYKPRVIRKSEDSPKQILAAALKKPTLRRAKVADIARKTGLKAEEVPQLALWAADVVSVWHNTNVSQIWQRIIYAPESRQAQTVVGLILLMIGWFCVNPFKWPAAFLLYLMASIKIVVLVERLGDIAVYLMVSISCSILGTVMGRLWRWSRERR